MCKKKNEETGYIQFWASTTRMTELPFAELGKTTGGTGLQKKLRSSVLDTLSLR